MIKVYQTIVDKHHGNCMQAAIASLLELSLEEVPNFNILGHEWFNTFYKFLLKYGYEYHRVEFAQINACGLSTNG
jgi:hypothetical protein